MTNLMDTLGVVLKWLIIVGIAWSVANTALYFLADPAVASVDEPQSGAAAVAQAFDLAEVERANLFGLADAVPQQVQTVQNEPDRDTTLPLELEGVFVAEHPEDSAAIISQRGKEGLLYGIDDVVPGNAKLVEVHGDHVVLRRVGVREILRFPAGPEGIRALPHDDEESVAEAAPADAPEPPPATARQFVERYRDQFTQNPEATLESLGVQTQGDGAGYRLQNLAESPYLSQTGLQPGDIILSVNGRPVGNIQQDQLEIDNVLAQGSARLEVQRGSRRFFVTASLQ